jgi:hypothetical protein
VNDPPPVTEPVEAKKETLWPVGALVGALKLGVTTPGHVVGVTKTLGATRTVGGTALQSCPAEYVGVGQS